MNLIKWLMLTLTLILSAGLAAPVAASPAHTRCVGELSNQTIAGDLIVPEGERCELINVTILGDVRVNQRSSLEVIESRIEGSLTGSRFERVSLRDASVGGSVRLTGGSSAELERATVGGDARLVEQVDARVLQSRVTGDLVVRGTGEVALFCGSTVEGDARFSDHRGGLLIGDDPYFAGICGANEVRGNLRVQHNSSDTIVANTSVGQNLVCTANDPAPIVYGNQVAGSARGQCGDGE
jgi:hypothetical protein